jgi:hypothetical protein
VLVRQRFEGDFHRLKVRYLGEDAGYLSRAKPRGRITDQLTVDNTVHASRVTGHGHQNIRYLCANAESFAIGIGLHRGRQLTMFWY